MQRTLAIETLKKIGEEVLLKGWVNTRRDHGKLVFIDLRDRTGIVQMVGGKELDILRPESAIEVKGKVKARPEELKNPNILTGSIEIEVISFNALSQAEELPYDLFGDTQPQLDTRLDWRFLDLRRPENYLIFKVQTTVEAAMREYWVSRDFIEIHSPKLMGSASESGAELFQLEYFGKTAYLAQSPQFYKQMAMAAGFEKVFEIGPVFRANPSFTSRHDTEFTSVDMEMSWIDSHEDIMAFEEGWLQFVLKEVKEKHGDDIKKYFNIEVVVPKLPFPRISMKEAVKILTDAGYTLPPEGKGDLDPQGEKVLFGCVKEKFNHEFVFVTNYPISVRPFYHMRHEDDPTSTKSFDLLWKGLEITTGAQREHRYDKLANQAEEKGLSLRPLQFYLDFFKYGCPPHGGFGYGLSRTLLLLFGLSNVREVTYLYRGPNRLTP